jgi:putative endonuclease
MHYVYILQSEVNDKRFYTGLTDDLRKRLQSHNAGRVLHTNKWKPWRLKTYVALADRKRAAEFERYPKNTLWPRVCQETLVTSDTSIAGA